jgi:hypothetical protein
MPMLAAEKTRGTRAGQWGNGTSVPTSADEAAGLKGSILRDM